MGKVSEQVLALVQPIAEQFGLEVLEVLYEKKYDGMNLTVVIDKDGGVTIEGAYILNVSSPGLDRPLKTERDYKRNLGKKISIKLYKPLNNNKTYEGVLTSYDDASFVILTKDGSLTFNKKDTAKVEPIIEF